MEESKERAPSFVKNFDEALRLVEVDNTHPEPGASQALVAEQRAEITDKESQPEIDGETSESDQLVAYTGDISPNDGCGDELHRRTLLDNSSAELDERPASGNSVLRSDRETVKLHQLLQTPLSAPHPTPSGILSLGGVCGNLLWLTLLWTISLTGLYSLYFYVPVLFVLLIFLLVYGTAVFKLYALSEFFLGVAKPAIHALDVLESFKTRRAPLLNSLVASLYRENGRNAQSFEHESNSMKAGPLACCSEEFGPLKGMSLDAWFLLNDEVYDTRSRKVLELIESARRDKPSAISVEVYVRALVHRATALYRLGRPDEGKHLYGLAVAEALGGSYESDALNPAYKKKALLQSHVLIERGESLLEQGLVSEARESLELAFEFINAAAGESLSDFMLKNRSVDALTVMISICIAEKDFEGAKRYQKKQAELDKIRFDASISSMRWHRQLAQILEFDGEFEGADSIYRRMLKVLRSSGERLSRDMIDVERAYSEFLLRHGDRENAEMVARCADADEATLRAYSSRLCDFDTSDRAIFDWYTKSKRYISKVVLLVMLSVVASIAIACVGHANAGHIMGTTVLIALVMVPSILFDFFRMRRFQFENLNDFKCYEIEYDVERFATYGSTLEITEAPSEFLEHERIQAVCDYFFPQPLTKGKGRGRLYIQPGTRRAVLVSAHSYIFCQVSKKVAANMKNEDSEPSSL